MSVPTQQPAPQALTPADSNDARDSGSTDAPTTSVASTPPSADGAPSYRPASPPVPHSTFRERIARVAAVILLIIICIAVVWPSGQEVAELKDSLGPAFLSSEGKDVVLNLVMLAPDIPWWMWALVGCVIGLSAEVLQSLLPMLERRPSLANVGQNAVGAWAGALAAWYLLRRRHPRPAST